MAAGLTCTTRFLLLILHAAQHTISWAAEISWESNRVG